MKSKKRVIYVVMGIISFFLLTVVSVQTALAVNARFDVSKMSDMSGFDPSNYVPPTGDTIKIAIVGSFSGPAAAAGEGFWLDAIWAAYDINHRGGIMVDGKRKLIQMIKADTMGDPAQAKLICEKMALEEKVVAMVGCDGSHIVKIMNLVGKKYHIITQNFVSLSDELQNAENFSPYAFMSWWQTSQVGRTFAYYYGKIRKKEKKFYILCQDYMFGHDLANGFKKALKEYYPEAQIVGEDYHRLFATDYAPYLTKIKASGAEVVYTGDWDPDATNLLKQARSFGIDIPFANIFMVNYETMSSLGVKKTQGLMLGTCYSNGTPYFQTPEQIKYYKAWKAAYEHFKPPYNSPVYSQGWDALTMEVYWLLSVIERAGSTNPEKIVKVWEGDSYEYINGHVATMRACDHNTIQDTYVIEFVPPNQQKVAMNIPPYHWTEKCSWWGPTWKIPTDQVVPWMDPKLDRCKGKNPGQAK